MRIATWNIRSLSRTGAFRELKEECQKYRWDVVALQEVRWPGRGMVEGKDYVLYYSGGEHRHELGIAFLIRKKYQDAIMDFRPIDERLCVLRIKGRYYYTTLVNAHAPTKEKDIQVKKNFYEKLERACDQSPTYDAKIILGDFNAQIGKEEHHRPTIGMHSMHASSNDNGERLINYAISKQLVIASTHHPHKSIHKGTWKSPGGETINQIDHVMIDARHRSNIQDVRSYRWPNIESDYFPVVARMRQRIDIKRKRREQDVMRGWRVAALREEEVGDRFRMKVAEKIGTAGAQQQDIEQRWRSMKRCLIKVAEETIGRESQREREGWFDEECRQAITNKNEKRLKYIQRQTRSSAAAYKEARSVAKYLMRRKKKETIETSVRELEETRVKNESRKFYRKVDRFSAQ